MNPNVYKWSNEMSLEIIELPNIPKRKTIWGRLKTYLLVCLAIAFVYATYASMTGDGSFIGNFLLVFITISIFGSFGVSFYSAFKTKSDLDAVHHAKQRELAKLGFNADYSATGVLIDTQQRKVAFTLYGDVPKSFICNFKDVRSWRQESYQQERQYTNANGVYAGRKTFTLAYYIKVTIASPDYPEFGFMPNSQQDSNLWISRLDALINA